MKKILLNFVLITISILMILPLGFMLLLSITQKGSQISLSDIFHFNFTFLNYFETFATDNFYLYFVNSIIVSSITTIANLFFCLLVAYSISRSETKYKNFIFYSVLGVMMVPPHIIMIPLYRLMVNFNWINTYWSLIIPWMVTPFGIFLLKQYLDQLPRDIEDAAKIDGAGMFYIIFKIVIPLSTPALAVLGIYNFLTNWNSFIFPFIFTNDEAHRTLPIGMVFYIGKQSTDWNHLMAGASISALPVIILFLIFQKSIIKGLTAGSLKG